MNYFHVDMSGVWRCEPTGETLVFTRKDVEKDYGDNTP